MSQDGTADIFVTKVTGSKRLVESSIQMRLRGDDFLAVYVVAHAAFSSLNDLLVKRNRDTFGDATAATFFYLGEALAAGRKLTHEEELLLAEPGYPDIAKEVYAAAQEQGLRGPDMRGKFPPKEVKALRDRTSKPANFLKHADRDADHALPESEFEADRMILTAIGCYMGVMNEISFVMQVFPLFLEPSDLVRRPHHVLHKVALDIEGLPEKDRARLCLLLITPECLSANILNRLSRL